MSERHISITLEIAEISASYRYVHSRLERAPPPGGALSEIGTTVVERPDNSQIERFRQAVLGGASGPLGGPALRHLCRDLFAERIDLCTAIVASDDIGLPSRIRRASGAQRSEERAGWASDLVTRGGIREPVAAIVVDLWLDVFTAARPSGSVTSVASIRGGSVVVRLRYSLDAHRGPVVSLAHHGETSTLLSASFDREAHLRDAASGMLRLVLRGHSGPIASATFDPAGERVLTASSDRSACIWDALTGEVMRILRGHSASVWSAVFSPDGTLIATGSSDSSVRLWDPSTGQHIASFVVDDGVDLVRFDASGRLLAAATALGTVHVWDVTTGQLLGSVPGHGSVWSLVFAPEGPTLIIGGEGGLHVAPISNLAGGLDAPGGHRGTVWSARISSDGTSVASAGADGTARIHRAGRREPDLVVDALDGTALASASFVNEDRWLLTVARHGGIDVWDIADGRHLASSPGTGGLETHVVSAQEPALILGTHRGGLARWDIIDEPRSF